MLILCEGVDGAGKSTLVEQLIEHAPMNTDTMHCGPIRKGALMEYEFPLRGYHPGGQQSVIADRWHVGEMVYGPMLRGESKVTPAVLEHIELFLASRGALKIWVDTPLTEVLRRISTRGDDLITAAQIPFIWDWYTRELQQQAGWWPISGAEYPSVRTIRDIYESAGALSREAAFMPRYYRHYVGAPAVDVMVIAPGGREPAGATKWDAPFKPYAGTYADRLLSSIGAIKPARRYGLLVAGSPAVRDVLNDIDYAKIIAVGAEAFDDARRLSDKHAQFIPIYAGTDSVARALKEAV